MNLGETSYLKRSTINKRQKRFYPRATDVVRQCRMSSIHHWTFAHLISFFLQSSPQNQQKSLTNSNILIGIERDKTKTVEVFLLSKSMAECSLSSVSRKTLHHQTAEQFRMIDDDIVSFDSVRTSNYATKLLQTLSSMRHTPDLCDFRLDVNDKHLYCHKFLLIATSDYFRVMFNGNMSESQANHVELKGFERSSHGVESIINFCYSGTLNITFDNIDELLHAGTHLQIRDAIDLCCQFLIESCSIKNCIDIYKISDLYALTNVLIQVKIFISQNFLLLMSQAREQFEQLTFDQMYNELSRDTLDMRNSTEFDLFQMTCVWIEANLSEREEYSTELFRLIRFKLMTPEELCDNVREHRLIKSNEEARKLVQNALCYYALPQRQSLSDDVQCRIRNEPILVAVGEIELFTLNMNAEKWDTLCQAPLEENYPYPFSAITVNNYLYVLGTRRSSSEEYKSCYRFSPRTCEWTKLQNLLHDRSRFAAAHVDSFIYIMGGFEGFKRTTRVYVNKIERYSIENDLWESFSSDGPQLSSLAACAYENSIYLGGGKNGQWSKIADFYCFSIENRQLEKRASMLHARTTHAFHIFDDKILAIGGFDDDGNGMLSIESYDLHSDQWTILTAIPGAVSKTWPQSLGTVGRRIYISVFHTSNSFIVMQEGYFFDLDTQQWVKAPVVHERARYCPTVQLRLPKSILKALTNSTSPSSTVSMSNNVLLMNT